MSTKNQTQDEQIKKLKLYNKILLAVILIYAITRPIAIYIVHKHVKTSVDQALTNEYPLIDPARKIIAQDKYNVNIQPLRTYLNELRDKIGSDNIAVYYEQLNSGANISINNDLRLFPASLVKLPLAILITKKIEQGTLKWDTELEVAADSVDSDSGNLYKEVGKKFTVEKIISELLVNSDNTAQRILLKQLGQHDMEDFEAEVGLENLFNGQGYISAKEFSRMLRVLYTSSYLERNDSQRILEYMTKSTFRDYLNQGIPNDVLFAHKYGEHKNESIFADSGIVYYDSKPYMLTVILKGKDSSNETRTWAVNLMKEISTRAYEDSK